MSWSGTRFNYITMCAAPQICFLGSTASYVSRLTEVISLVNRSLRSPSLRVFNYAFYYHLLLSKKWHCGRERINSSK